MPVIGRTADVTLPLSCSWRLLLAPEVLLSGSGFVALPYLGAALKLTLEDICKLGMSCGHEAQVSAEPNHYLIM